jgi:DNA-binding IclR family transcriptional regulator
LSTLANAREVLKLIAKLRRDITVTDAATELGLPKSSASRTLSMMAEYGFLARDPATRAYRPGDVIMQASYHFRSSQNALSLLEEELVKLVQDTGFTGYINVLEGADTLVIQMRPGASVLQVYTPPGTRGPAHATSPGRAILARMSDEEATHVVGALGASRQSSQRALRDLHAKLAEVRKSGVATSRGEFVPHVGGVAAAVFDSASAKAYSIGIAIPAAEISESLVRRLMPRVRDAASRVGLLVGDPYWLAAGSGHQ